MQLLVKDYLIYLLLIRILAAIVFMNV